MVRDSPHTPIPRRRPMNRWHYILETAKPMHIVRAGGEGANASW